MSRTHWSFRVARYLIWLLPGATVLGGGCSARDVRDSLVAAGLDFVQDSALELLDAAFPVAELLGAEQCLENKAGLGVLMKP